MECGMLRELIADEIMREWEQFQSMCIHTSWLEIPSVRPTTNIVAMEFAECRFDRLM